MTDQRPTDCRFRLQDENKAYPRSSCAACGRSVFNGLGKECHYLQPDEHQSTADNEAKLIDDCRTVCEALNKLSQTARKLNIAMTISQFHDSTRIDIDLERRKAVDFKVEITGVDTGFARPVKTNAV